MPRPRARVPRSTDVPDAWRNRIVEYGEMSAEEFMAHPDNPRIHGPAQKAAMGAMLTDIGWLAPVVVNRTTGRMIDGHMRTDIAVGRGGIPVAWVELTEDEEREALALMDPIGAMATYDSDIVGRLTEGLETSVDMEVVLGSLLPDGDDEDKPRLAETVQLAPLKKAHILLSVPLERWDEVAAILDAAGEVEGVVIASTVN